MTNRVDINVNLNDNASSGFRRLEQQTREIQRRLAEQARRTAEESARAARQEQDAHIRAYREIQQARERLGVRAHSQIREDINRTREAYRVLSASGMLSFREQQQAADRMRQSIRNLTNEMGHLTREQRAYGALQFGARVGGGVMGGIVGAGLAMRAPVTNALELERHLADIVNTGYPERDPNGRLITIKSLADVVHKTVKDSGIKLDGAVILLDALIASGVMSVQQVINNLPLASRTVVANRADPLSVAASISKLYGGHTVKNDEESRIAQNMMVAAGQAGGNEYRYLAQYLPKQLAEGSGSGLLGLPGLRKILIADEASMLFSGTPEQANINVENLLTKLNSHDTANHLKKMGRGDLSSYLMRRNAQGVDSLTAIIEIIQDEVRRDNVLKGHINALKKNKDKKNINAAIDSISAIGIGRVISELVPDRQARGALYAMLNTEYVDKVAAAIDKAMVARNGPNERNFETIAGTTSFKLDVLNNAIDASQKRLIDENLTPNISKAADKANSFSEQNPTMFKYLSIAPWAVSGITGSMVGQAMLAGGAGWMLRGVFRGGVAETGVAGASSALVAPAIARASALFSEFTASATAFLSRAPALLRAGGSGVATYAPAIARVSGVAGAAYTGYQAGSLIYEGLNKVISAFKGHEENFGGFVYELTHYTPKPVEVNTTAHIQVGLAPGLVPLNQNITSTGNAAKGDNKAKVNTGNLWEGAP